MILTILKLVIMVNVVRVTENVQMIIVVVNMVGVVKAKIIVLLDVNPNLDNVLRKKKKLPNCLLMVVVVMDMVDVQKVNVVVNMAGVVILMNIVLLTMVVKQNMAYVKVKLCIELVNAVKTMVNVQKVIAVVNSVGVVKLNNTVEKDAKVNLVNVIKSERKKKKSISMRILQLFLVKYEKKIEPIL